MMYKMIHDHIEPPGHADHDIEEGEDGVGVLGNKAMWKNNIILLLSYHIISLRP
jgi:hypothetical protein